MMTTQAEAKKDIVNNQQETIEKPETSASSESKKQELVKKEKNTSTSTSDHKKMKDGKFLKKLISIPIIKESLTSTQHYVIQFPIGKQIYDQTYSIFKVIKKQAKKTQQSNTFTYYFPKDGYIRQSVKQIDGWASHSLDFVTTNVPLIQQPTDKLVHTLVTQPHDFVLIQWKRTKKLPSFVKKNMDYLLKLPALSQLESEYHKNIEPITVSVKSQWRKSNAAFFKK